MITEKDKEIHSKVEKAKSKIVVKELLKTLTEVMRAVGYVFLFGFSMIGGIVYYIIQGISIIQAIFIASVVIVMLFALTQVKEVK